jgi:hypothetical protein
VRFPPANLPHCRSCGREECRKCLRLLVEREGRLSLSSPSPSACFDFVASGP